MSFIDPRKSFTYFTSNYKLRPSTNGWQLFNCPLCDGNMVGSVQFKFGKVKCFKGCYDESIIEFVARVEDMDEKEAKEMLWRLEVSSITLDDLEGVEEQTAVKFTKTEITLPDGFNSIKSGTGALAIRARRYLKQRNFDIDELDAEGFGYCDVKHKEFEKDFYGYIIVPFKRSGRLYYYLGRSFIGHDEMRYKNPPVEFVGIGKSEVVFNEDALHLYKEAYVFEGWSDARTMGRKGTATLGWSMSPTQKAIYFNSKVNRLVFIPDAGVEMGTGMTFYQKATQVAIDFIEAGKEVYVVDLNPIATDKKKDANSLGKEAVMYLYKHTKPLTMGLAMKILTTKNKYNVA